MGWQELLSVKETRVLPWLGERRLAYQNQSWRIQGRLPAEYGWYQCTLEGRNARVVSRSDPDPDFEQGHKIIRGYLAGDRLIPDNARVDPDPNKLIDQTLPVLLVEPGLDRFARAVVIPLPTETDKVYLYMRQEFPVGPEADVEAAYLERLESVSHVSGVTPALDLAFRWLSYLRLETERLEREEEARRAEEERKRLAEERLREALRNNTGAGRRALAVLDFNTAARQALALSGAELLDARPSYNKNEMVVQYRFRHRRLECVVTRETLRVVDSGVCLGHGAEKGDTLFTLESITTVIGEALDRGILVVYRHAPGDRDRPADNDGHGRDRNLDEDEEW